jgi:uncharacterized protein
MIAGIRAMISYLLVLGVRGYQICIRPLLPAACRYQPSCSEYFIQSVRKYGPLSGAWRGTKRICRCHPWSAGGYDPP